MRMRVWHFCCDEVELVYRGIPAPAGVGFSFWVAISAAAPGLPVASLLLSLRRAKIWAGLLGLALGLIELGELKLGEVRRNGAGLAFAELGVDLDGLGVLTGLLIEVGEGILAEGGKAAVPAGGDLFEDLLRRAELTLIDVGEADEVLGKTAGVGEAVLAGYLLELGVGGGGAGLGVGVSFDAGGRGFAGGGERSLVDTHSLAEGGGRSRGAALIERIASDEGDDRDHGDDGPDDGLLAVLFCPMDARFGESYKLVWLFQLTLGCVIHERSVLQGYKKIAGPTAHASFQFSRDARWGRWNSIWAVRGPIIAGGRVIPVDLAESACQPYLDGHSICVGSSQAALFLKHANGLDRMARFVLFIKKQTRKPLESAGLFEKPTGGCTKTQERQNVMAWYAYCITERNAFSELGRHRRPMPLTGVSGLSEIKPFFFPQPTWLWWYRNTYRKTQRS